MKARGARWLAAGLIGGVFVYCGARERGARPPGDVKPGPVAMPVVASAARPRPIPTPLSLEGFRPLLATPGLERVAAAVESGAPADAARELSVFLAQSPPAAGARFRYDFLLGRLSEQASAWAAALAAYQNAAEPDSPLRAYARTFAARALLALGKPKEALERLAEVPDDGPVALIKWGISAEAARLRSDRALALAMYRKSLEKLRGRERSEVSLRFAGLLLEPGASTSSDDALVEALGLARRALADASLTRSASDAAKRLEVRALASMSEALRNAHRDPSPAEALERVRALLEARAWNDAERAARELSARLSGMPGELGRRCESEFLLGKALAAERAWSKAGEAFEGLRAICPNDSDLRARALYLAGKAAASDGEQMLAVQRFTTLEREAPGNSLADDARLQAALAYLELGVEARFTELLSTLPDDYPDGDMVVEGLFRLALRRIDKSDWAGAGRVLERALGLVRTDSGRGPDFAGRERYFHARTLVEARDLARAKDEFELVLRELPFSYYMLAAYTRLSALDADRARAALEASLSASPSEPILVAHRPEFSSPGFERALELLLVGDIDDGESELDALGIVDPGAAPELLWGVSLLYARAGSVKLSHAAARRALGSTPAHFPSEPWLPAWQLAYPEPYKDIVEREAKRGGVSASLIYAIMREESAFDPDAESPADAYGLMQLILPTAKVAARPLGLAYDRAALRRPSVNIALGASVLATYGAAFPENPLLAIPAYNAGPGKPRRWLKERPHADFDVWVELIPYVETRRYVKRVLASRAAYAFLYQRETFEAVATLPLTVQE